MENNYFINLNKINIADKTETKGRLKYLSWTYAWEQLKRIHPNANYAIIKNNKGWIYHTDERTAWVEVSVTVDEITHTEYLPVMDNRNQSISLDKITSMDANKAIQRAITKAIARHGIGLCLYAGEDISDDARLDDEIEVACRYLTHCTAEKKQEALAKAIAKYGDLPQFEQFKTKTQDNDIECDKLNKKVPNAESGDVPVWQSYNDVE